MFNSVNSPKNLTVKRPGSAAGYGPSPTDTATNNWGNAFRGKGWDGAKPRSIKECLPQKNGRGRGLKPPRPGKKRTFRPGFRQTGQRKARPPGGEAGKAPRKG
jgi:hypothetical protein